MAVAAAHDEGISGEKVATDLLAQFSTAQARQVLQEALAAIDEEEIRRNVLKRRVLPLIAAMANNFPAIEHSRLWPGLPDMLGELAARCAEVEPELLATDPDWHCIVVSLRAECLYLTEGADSATAMAAAGFSELVYACLAEPSLAAEARHEFNLKLLETGDPPLTSLDFFHDLMVGAKQWPF